MPSHVLQAVYPQVMILACCRAQGQADEIIKPFQIAKASGLAVDWPSRLLAKDLGKREAESRPNLANLGLTG